ncbi:MAG TPA: hypothetical protein VN643_16570 [Pyrinomonadaceae bacterium]|nr:hypothetical protein [Pyrinomonadaceae bacterium]
MSRLITCFGLLLCLLSLGLAQKKARTPTASEQANAAWPAFLKSFREAVKRRDKAALKRMMVRDFFFSNGSDENNDGDTRDEAFKFMADPEVKGWQALDKVLSKGVVAASPEPNAQGKTYPRRVAPPEAKRIKSLENAPPWIASFEFRNGQWYFTMLSECCD